jgi:hypothetical protein
MQWRPPLMGQWVAQYASLSRNAWDWSLSRAKGFRFHSGPLKSPSSAPINDMLRNAGGWPSLRGNPGWKSVEPDHDVTGVIRRVT